MTAILNTRTHARKMATKYGHVQLHDMGYTLGGPLRPWDIPRDARYYPYPHSLGCDRYPGKPATTLSPTPWDVAGTPGSPLQPFPPLPAPGPALPIY